MGLNIAVSKLMPGEPFRNGVYLVYRDPRSGLPGKSTETIVRTVAGLILKHPLFPLGCDGSADRLPGQSRALTSASLAALNQAPPCGRRLFPCGKRLRGTI